MLMICLAKRSDMFCHLFYNADANLLLLLFLFAVTATLLNFTRLFLKAHEENCKQTVLEKKKADKEAEMEKAKGINFIRKSGKDEEEES